MVLIVGLILAYPTGYLMQTLIERRRPDATLLVVEIVGFGAVWLALRMSRRF